MPRLKLASLFNFLLLLSLLLLLSILLPNMGKSVISFWLNIDRIGDILHRDTRFSVTKTQFWSSIRFCTRSQRRVQGQKFRQLIKQSHYWSSCYSDDYLLQLYQADMDMSNDNTMLFFDVGANKGYVVATWLSLWMPKLGINARSLYNYLRSALKLNDCGVCDDCKEIGFNKWNLRKRVKKTIEIHAFEPQPSNFEILRQVQQWINVSSFHIHALALSNQSGTALFDNCYAGSEICGLAIQPNVADKEKHVKVKVTTLDDFVQEHHITRRIDVLKIDTEGFDPLVLQGADRLLSEHRIRLLVFEYHGIAMWTSTTLFQVLDNLDNKGYLCYQLGRTGILRLTGCWSQQFETKAWSNVLCVSKKEQRLRTFIEKLLVKF